VAVDCLEWEDVGAEVLDHVSAFPGGEQLLVRGSSVSDFAGWHDQLGQRTGSAEDSSKDGLGHPLADCLTSQASQSCASEFNHRRSTDIGRERTHHSGAPNGTTVLAHPAQFLGLTQSTFPGRPTSCSTRFLWRVRVVVVMSDHAGGCHP
jgi:hypothetical protein